MLGDAAVFPNMVMTSLLMRHGETAASDGRLATRTGKAGVGMGTVGAKRGRNRAGRRWKGWIWWQWHALDSIPSIWRLPTSFFSSETTH